VNYASPQFLSEPNEQFAVAIETETIKMGTLSKLLLLLAGLSLFGRLLACLALLGLLVFLQVICTTVRIGTSGGTNEDLFRNSRRKKETK
jgi:hypothetical protein